MPIEALSDIYIKEVTQRSKTNLFWDAAVVALGGNPRLAISAGHKIGEPEIIFRKIEVKEVEELRNRFAGEQKLNSEEAKLFTFPLDLTVGVVKSASPHPDASYKAFVLQVDCKEAKDRQIVSALTNDYKPEELVGKKVVVLKNIKHANFRSVQSQGMLLTAVQAGDHGNITGLLIVPNGNAGDRISPVNSKIEVVPTFDVKTQLPKLMFALDSEGKLVCSKIAVETNGNAVVAEKVNATSAKIQ
jgi:methionine--tRNA ligase beta chain